MEQGKPEACWGVVKYKGKEYYASEIKEEFITRLSVWEDKWRKIQVTKKKGKKKERST